jgi:hypothetical protein
MRFARRARHAAWVALLGALVLGACGTPTDRPLTEEALLRAEVPPTSTIVPPTSATTTPPSATPSRAPATSRATTPSRRPSTTSRAAAAPAPAGPAGRTLSTLVTYYAAYDNDPPGSRAIAHPNARHSQAGGTGTFADPITMATDPREVAVGTIVYYPALKKYFVMEDDCESCIGEWSESRTYHLDFYVPNGNESGVLECQNALTPGGRVNVEIGAPAGRPVDTTPLYSNGRCISG